MSYEKKRCWSILFRLYHWGFAISIIFLVASGLYINNPWTNTMQEYSMSWPMAWMRYIHFLAGYIFTAAVIIRLFLFLFGNAQEKIIDILPITGRNLKNLGKTLLLYSYISDEHDDRLGHNVLAGITYIITALMAIFQLVSGFYLLYPESATWEGIGVVIFMSQQNARLVHHLFMWWFIIFALVHVYFVIWNDVKESEGLVSSIFTGDKYKHIK